MSTMNYDGTIDATKVYTEHQLRLILDISEAQLLEYFKAGLRFFQKTRQQPRQIAGSEYHRFVERNSTPWEEAVSGE